MFKRLLFVVLSVALIVAYESAIGQSQEIKTPTTAEAMAADLKLTELSVATEETPCLISPYRHHLPCTRTQTSVRTLRTSNTHTILPDFYIPLPERNL